MQVRWVISLCYILSVILLLTTRYRFVNMQAQKKDLHGPAAARKEKKRGAKTSAKPDHPRYKEMIAEALKDLKKPRGASRQAISKYITSKYSVSGSSSNHHLSTALKSLVSGKSLVITKGVGAAGSYKVNRETTAKKPSVKKTAKPKKKAASKKVVKKRTAKTNARPKKGVKAVTKNIKAKRSAPKVNKRGRKK